MKYKIVVDSSSNLRNDYIKDDKVGFEVVPLIVRVDDKEYVDNEDFSVDEMLTKLKDSTSSSSSCPSPGKYAEAYKGAENVFVITVSAKLSGSFNAAFVASLEYEDSHIHLIDSKATGGLLQLIVDRTYELIKKGLNVKEIEDEIDKYVESVNLLFILDRFDNLVRAGRMSKIAAFVAQSLSIKPICIASKGEIKIHKRTRTMKMAIKQTVQEIKNVVQSDPSERVCIITSVQHDPTAEKLKTLIENNINFKEVRIVDATILCSYYALQGSLLIAF